VRGGAAARAGLLPRVGRGFVALLKLGVFLMLFFLVGALATFGAFLLFRRTG
jgi:hypothetical protein